jgi:hypothetical protein
MQIIMKNYVKVLAAIVVTMAISLSGYPQEGYSECVDKKRSSWGEECTQCPVYRDSYVVYLQNICQEKLDMQVAVQEEDMTWKVFTFSTVAPNDSVRAYACRGKGKYLAWAKVAGDTNTVFPTKADVNREYKN